MKTTTLEARVREATDQIVRDCADFGHTCFRWMLKLTGGLPE